MSAENLIYKGVTPKTLINVELATKGAKLIFSDGTSLFTTGKSEMPIDGDIITIYRHVGNARFSIDYNLASLDKFASTTPEELVLHWQANGFFFDDLGATSTSDLSDFSDVTPLFLKDQISPANLADVLVDGNYCVRNAPADLVAQGITGHTIGDVLKRTAGAWSFVLTPTPGVTFVFIEGDFRRHVFSDDPTAGVSPIFVLQQDPFEPFSVFALGTDLPGAVVFNGTTLVYTNAGGLTVADIHNAAFVLVSGVVPYFIEDTVNPERSGVYDLIINDTVGGTYTFRRSYSFRNNADFIDGQSFFISPNGGTVAENDYLFVLDQQFILNTDALSIILGRLSDVANAATVATEEFANTDARFFGNIGVPPGQQDWVDASTGTATLDLVNENVFGNIKQVVKLNDNTADGIAKTIKPLTPQNWIDINIFGKVSFGGIARLDSIDGDNGFTSTLQADAAENPLVTGNRRYGIIFNNNGGNLRLTESDNGANNVTMDGTSGNPLIVFDEWFLWRCSVPIGLGAAQLFINGILTTFVPTFITNLGGLGTEIRLTSGSTGGVDRISYHDNFGVTILEESTIKTLKVVSMAAKIAQAIAPALVADFEISIPDGAGRAIGSVLEIVANNVGGTITIKTENLGTPQALINGFTSVEKFIAKTQVIRLINTIEGSNIYEGAEFNSGLDFHHSGVVSVDQLGVSPLSILTGTSFRIAPIHAVFVDRELNTKFPNITHMLLAQTDHVITGGGDQIIQIHINKQGNYVFDTNGPVPIDVTELIFVGKAVMDAGVISLVVFTPIIAYTGSVDEMAELIGRGGQKTKGSVIAGGGANLTISVTPGDHQQLGRGFLSTPDAPNQCATINQDVFAFTGNPGSLFLSFVDAGGNFVIDSIQSGALPEIDPEQFNNSGVLSAMPVNDFQAIRLIQFCETEDIVAYYGTVAYANLAAAEAGFLTEDPESFDATGDGSWICTILVKKGTTDLQAGVGAGDVKFITRSGRRDF